MGIALLLALAKARPDYNIQPGDDGSYGGDHDHDHDHSHDHDHGHEEVAPPPPPPANDNEKQCTLVKEKTPSNPSMCFLEPECKQECKEVPKETCTPYEDTECVESVEKVCEVVQESVCQTNYLTQFENQCSNKLERECEIT